MSELSLQQEELAGATNINGQKRTSQIVVDEVAFLPVSEEEIQDGCQLLRKLSTATIEEAEQMAQSLKRPDNSMKRRPSRQNSGGPIRYAATEGSLIDGTLFHKARSKRGSGLARTKTRPFGNVGDGGVEAGNGRFISDMKVRRTTSSSFEVKHNPPSLFSKASCDDELNRI